MTAIESTLAPLFSELSDGICTAEGNGRILYLNRAAEGLLGLPSAKAAGRSLCALLCARLSAPGRPECASRCPLRDPNSPRKSVTFTGRFSPPASYRWQEAGVVRAEKRKDLRVMCLRMPGAPIFDGREKHFIIIEDVSAELELERQREDWRSMIAHDLRIPLTNIFGALRSLQEDAAAAGLKPDAAELIGIGVRSCERMTEMVDEYLDVAKLDAGLMPVETAAVELSPLIARCVQEQKPLIKQKDIKISIAAPAGLKASADPRLLARTLHNLLDNALKFTPAGGCVEIATAAAPPRVSVSVKDEGGGIAPEELPRLFDRYHQAQTRRQGGRAGTGLGLAFCRQALETMNGSISAESRLGSGSVFTICLPGA